MRSGVERIRIILFKSEFSGHPVVRSHGGDGCRFKKTYKAGKLGGRDLVAGVIVQRIERRRLDLLYYPIVLCHKHRIDQFKQWNFVVSEWGDASGNVYIEHNLKWRG